MVLLIVGTERMWRLCNAIAGGVNLPTRVEGVPELHPLAPKYDPTHHSAYVSVLQHALMQQPTVRNIALSGTYGTGKSSILAELARRFKERVLEVSLLTLGEEPENTGPPTAETNPAASTTTNRIQKEIVKQLLYQQSPASTPESRFRRITRFRWLRESLYALLIGLAILVILAASGLNISALPNIGVALDPLPSWLRSLSVYVSIPFMIGVVVLVARLFIHGRLGVEKVSAGPATITLPARSTSYFDEYLDEIIYFFETNRTRDILIIEDLDRFNDPRIFESLRALNSLLNAAKQLAGRDIRFIYAVRDSVFEKLGRDADETDDQAKAELQRANRTKFFELVIPVVPFITHKNARDLMHDLLEKRGHEISKDLIDLAARHVADMRLIHNIVNEYEIFEHRLLKVVDPVPDLDSDRLFAMILLKNAHMKDFEAIRHGSSSLDKLYTAWRSLVSANVRAIRSNNQALRRSIEAGQAREDRAAALAARLRSVISNLVTAKESPFVHDTIYLNGKPIDHETVATPSFWQAVARPESQLSLAFRNYSPYSNTNVTHMVLSTKTVQNLIGEDINLEPFERAQVLAAEGKISQNNALLPFLRRHTWSQLLERSDFKHMSDGTPKTFREIAEHLLPSPLVLGLVVGGYVTTHFTLHVSSFYGQVIRPDAMVYIMRNVDHGVADPEYPLDGADVESILRDQGDSVLTERSMFNTSILDYLLSEQPHQAVTVAKTLAAAGEEGLKFISTYLSSGVHKVDFIVQVTPLVPSVFTRLVDDASLDAQERAVLIDAAIGARSNQIEYDDSERLRKFVEDNYELFPSLTGGRSGTEPKKSVDFIGKIGALLPDLSRLSDNSCSELAATTYYRVSAKNLERILRDDNLSLDRLKHAGEEVYLHAISHMDDYKAAYEESPASRYTIEDPAVFESILRDAKDWLPSDFAFVVGSAHSSCRASDLTDVPQEAWLPIVASQRTEMTYGNIARYIQFRGEIDEALASSLQNSAEIQHAADTEQEERAVLALSVLNASQILPDLEHRISLALSLDPGQLPAASIRPESGELVGRLIRDELILDDEDAFSSRLMIDWPTLEYAIGVSVEYENFVSPATLASEYLPQIMSSPSISGGLRSAVLGQIHEGLFPNVPKSAYEAIAEADLRGDLNLSWAGIDLLISGGVSQSRIIELVARKIASLKLAQLQVLLRNLGGPYSRIADKGRSITKLDDTPEHHAILESLRRGGIVSRFPAGLDSKLKVSLKRP